MNTALSLIEARIASEPKIIECISQLPLTLYINGHVARRSRINKEYHSFDVVEYACKLDDSVILIPFFQNNDNTQTVTVREAKSLKGTSNLICRLVSGEALFPISLDLMLKRFNSVLAREFKSFVIASKPSTSAALTPVGKGKSRK